MAGTSLDVIVGGAFAGTSACCCRYGSFILAEQPRPAWCYVWYEWALLQRA